MGEKWTKGQTPKNTVVAEGIEAFPENIQILKRGREESTSYLNLEEKEPWWPYYHGFKRNECLMVRWRREKTYQNHFLDIFYCLTHEVEVCRCGMEWGYYQNELYLEEAQTHGVQNTQGQ